MATYTITNYTELQAMSSHLADDCVLANDIDCSASRTSNARPGYTGEYYGFQPIGTGGSPFTGSFDGAGFTLSNLYINRGQGDGVAGESYGGLFGAISAPDKEFKDVTMIDCDISSRSIIGLFAGNIAGTSGNEAVVSGVNVSGTLTLPTGNSGNDGGLVGWSTSATYTNCSSSVTISITKPVFSGGYGGFCGLSANSDFTNCSSGGTITTTGTGLGNGGIGGFCGIASSTASHFTSCKSSVSIANNAVTSGSGASNCGGFIGSNLTASFTYCYATGAIISSDTYNTRCGGFAGSSAGITTECMAIGDVNASGATTGYVGGLCGINTGTITSCYSRGNVCKNDDVSGTYYVGGLVGQSAGNRTDCYSTGYVNTSATKYGGFIGDYVSGTLTTCYWDTETSGTADAVEGSAKSGVTGYTTAEMKLEATYVGFDFDATWIIPTYIQPAISQSNLTVWPSKTGDYEGFDDDVKDDDAFVVVIPSTNEIRWIESIEALLIGTAADEWKLASNKLDTPLSPTNFGVKRQSNWGSENIQPIAVNEVLLYVDFVGRKIREMTYSGEKEKYVSPDLSSLAEHITETGIVCMAHQKNPDSILWCVLTDGSLIGMVYDREQNVVAWFDCPVDGTVQSVCVVPGSNEDEIWISVKRTINGSNYVYIEKMETRIPQAIEDSYFADSFIIDTGTSTTISGLDHLEGETVVALVDGVYDGTFTVASGAITINTTPVSQTIVGLPFTALLQPMRIVANSQSGSSMGAMTRIHDLKISFLNTKGVQYGDSTSNLTTVNFDDERFENANYITGLYSGDMPVNMSGGFSIENPIIISNSQPYPMTIKAIVAGFEQSGR